MSERPTAEETLTPLAPEEVMALKQRFHAYPGLLGQVAAYRTKLMLEEVGLLSSSRQVEWSAQHAADAAEHLTRAVCAPGSEWPTHMIDPAQVGELLAQYDAAEQPFVTKEMFTNG